MIHTGIQEDARRRIAEGLQQFLTDSYALYLKTQLFHWNVKGAEFYSLHLFFEKEYNELAEAIDEIAERIRALGFYVEAHFGAFLKQAKIHGEEKVLTAKEMVEALLQGNEHLSRSGRAVSKIAEEANDGATVDLMGRRLISHEKAAWMLRSTLSIS